MKETSETISQSFFNHLPSGYLPGSKQTASLCTFLKTRIVAIKDQLLNGIASLGIGAILLLALYLFFSQLAEHGWS